MEAGRLIALRNSFVEGPQTRDLLSQSKKTQVGLHRFSTTLLMLENIPETPDCAFFNEHVVLIRHRLIDVLLDDISSCLCNY